MPGCAVHLLLATRVLAHESTRAGEPLAPGPGGEQADRAAFFAGCMGPDFGYYPGGDVVFAELAHYLRPADLARSLWHSAPDSAARAFARGWATHVLADALIHPLINRESARQSGDAGGTSTFADDPGSHVRIEVGLDAYYAPEPEISKRPWPEGPAAGPAVEWLAAAYDATYGVRVNRIRLRATCRRALRLLPWMLDYERLIGPHLRGERLRPGLVGSVLREIGRCFPRGSVSRGLLSPAPPSAILIAGLDDVFADFSGRFLAHADSDLADLPQYNLDTGGIEGVGPEYPLSRSSRDTVGRMQALAIADRGSQTANPPR